MHFPPEVDGRHLAVWQHLCLPTVRGDWAPGGNDESDGVPSARPPSPSMSAKTRASGPRLSDPRSNHAGSAHAGLEPGNISVHISEGRGHDTRGGEGPHQHEQNLLLAEWSVGPYHRMVTLPHPVNGVLTNATYSNGVLVIAMPKMSAWRVFRSRAGRRRDRRARGSGCTAGRAGDRGQHGGPDD
jgi:Hsp20/alpha crystallin family